MSSGLYSGVSGLALGVGLTKGVSGLWGGASGLIAGFGGTPFSPASLFAAGEQGYWLDPSDFTTMFQDAAGATPVTATGQSVRRMLDKSGRGNHFTQANTANAPILGREPFGGRRNLATSTEQFDNAVWVKNATGTLLRNETDPTGAANSATTLVADSAGGTAQVYAQQVFSTTLGVSYTMSAYVKQGTQRYAVINIFNGFANASLWFDLQAGTSGVLAGSGAAASIAGAGNGWFRCVVTATATSTTSAATIRIAIADDNTDVNFITPRNGTSSILVWGAQLEIGSTATAYQRVTTAFDVTQAGVPDCYYLQYDGSDDWLQSAATINPGAVDKAQVFAGVRKLSDAGDQALLETSAGASFNNGAISLFAPVSGGANYNYGSRGTTFRGITATTFTAPITNVVTGISDISGDAAQIRVNGAVAGTNTGDQGTGDYLTYTHYIGRRGGTSLPFNGRVYQMVMRFGPNLTAGQITQTENYVAGETGIYNVEQLNRFAVIDASGASFNAYGAADASSNNYLVPKTVLAADGTPYSVL